MTGGAAPRGEGDPGAQIAAPRRRARIRLFVWVILLGILPTICTTWLVINARFDAGFYMPSEFLASQRALVLRIGLYLATPAVLLLWIVVRRTLAQPQYVAGRALQALSLIAVLGWLSYAVPLVREDVLVPQLSQSEVEAYAAVPIGPRLYEAGLVDMSLQDRVFTLHLEPAVLEPTRIPVAELTPRLCRNFGRLFAGPVDVVRSEFTAPAGDRFFLDIYWQDCRGWYLQNRDTARQPLAQPPMWQLRHFDWPILTTPPGIAI